MEEDRSAFKILTGKPSGRPRCRWDNIRMDLKEIGVNMRNWIDFSSGWGLLESPCECGVESPGPISHGIS